MTNVRLLIQQLSHQTVGQLQQTYTRATGEPSRSFNRTWLIKKIAYATQEAAKGGLSERARTRATELARDQDLRVRPPQHIHDALKAAAAPTAAPAAVAADTQVKVVSSGLPPVGSVIVKPYRGRRLEVQVVADGFVYEQQHFKSLSAVARRITGANWNGRLFFGITSR